MDRNLSCTIIVEKGSYLEIRKSQVVLLFIHWTKVNVTVRKSQVILLFIHWTKFNVTIQCSRAASNFYQTSGTAHYRLRSHIRVEYALIMKRSCVLKRPLKIPRYKFRGNTDEVAVMAVTAAVAVRSILPPSFTTYLCVYTLTCRQVDDCRITGRYRAVTP